MKLARFVALAVPLTVAAATLASVHAASPEQTERGASTSATAPTFNKDVAPILYENCATCHRPGEVAPFPLLTFQDAAKRAPLIAAVTGARQMPPWKTEPGHGTFLNERRLTDVQIATLKAWSEAGAPEGDAKDKPTLPRFPEGWQAGEPDQVVTMGSAY